MMRITIIGGDMRQVYAADFLCERGHEVSFYSPFSRPQRARILTDPVAELERADAVLLPIPATGSGGVIRGLTSLLPSEVLTRLRTGSLLFGGNLSASLVASARERGIRTVDYLNLESFVLQNAYLTAQAALGILLSELPICLYRTKIAILGFGRIGKFLSRMLHALGAQVTVLARKSSDLAMASLIGVSTLPLSRLQESDALAFADAVVNTAPARILCSAHLEHLKNDTLLLELASGSDNLPKPAPEKPIRILCAQGLPGKCFPKSAAEIVTNATEEALLAL